MKRVLIIAKAFPPSQAIGAQRPFGLAKHFPNHGWEPVVLTVKRESRPVGIKIIEAEHVGRVDILVKKTTEMHWASSEIEPALVAIQNRERTRWQRSLVKLVKECVYYPDRQIGWYKSAVQSAIEYLRHERVDVIISTSSPETDHLIAKKLKSLFRIPWVADFRDPWTQNAYRDKYRIIQYVERRLEKKTIAGADAIVTVTEPWIGLLSSLHKNKQIYHVTNGFDIDDFSGEPPRLTGKFTITYTGSLYEGKRDPSILFQIIQELVKENKINRALIEVRFYGFVDDWAVKKARDYGLQDIICFYGNRSREEVLHRLRESQLLLLLVWNNSKEEGFCPAKLYEYLGARRPVLGIGWPGSVAKTLIEKTRSGCFSTDYENLKDNLLRYYSEFLENGEVKFQGNEEINNYKYSSIAGQYAQIINGLVSNKKLS